MFFVEKRDVLAAIMFELYANLPYGYVTTERHDKVVGFVTKWLDEKFKLVSEQDRQWGCLDFEDVTKFSEWLVDILNTPEAQEFNTWAIEASKEDTGNLKEQTSMYFGHIVHKAVEKLSVFQTYMYSDKYQKG